jgi:hypothetical protein
MGLALPAGADREVAGLEPDELRQAARGIVDDGAVAEMLDQLAAGKRAARSKAPTERSSGRRPRSTSRRGAAWTRAASSAGSGRTSAPALTTASPAAPAASSAFRMFICGLPMKVATKTFAGSR